MTNTCPMHRAGDEYTPDASGRKGVLQIFFRFLMEKIGASQSGICFLHGLSGGRQISALGVGRTMIPPSAPPRAGSLSSLRRGPKFVTRPPAHVEILDAYSPIQFWLFAVFLATPNSALKVNTFFDSFVNPDRQLSNKNMGVTKHGSQTR